MNFFLIWFSKAFQNRIPFLMVINDDISGLLATPAVQLNVVVVMCLIFIPPPTSPLLLRHGDRLEVVKEMHWFCNVVTWQL